ncbi:MAG TPA: c-type cytochrome [Burkholderiales bacterium]|nr:c-type cytochrome [Burkholderiales bacterium]
MKTRVVLGLVLCAALLACSNKEEPPSKSAGSAQPAADLAAGKGIAERECKGCHGLDGKGLAPGIPTLAAQRYRYLVEAMDEYRQGKRIHVVLRKIAEGLTQAQEHDVLAYYASQPPVASKQGKPAHVFSPYEEGGKLSAECARCHGADGNSVIAGTPTLAGQQPRYLVAAMQEYLNAERPRSPMHPMLVSLNRLQMESLALYFASQAPAERAAPPFGDPKAGEPLSAVCGGCHGPSGVSADTATPRLAGQDPRYLVDAIKAYRTLRKREAMRIYVSELSDKQIDDIAAFYSIQKSKPAESGQTLVQDLTDKCNRCHGPEVADNPNVAFPKINGQDRDYLIMALRAYRDDRRQSTMMHTMSLPYGDAIIESLADYYSTQPAN